MQRLAITALLLALAATPACAQLDSKPALDFTGTGADTAFSRSVAARYSGGVSADAIRADLAAQGFSCSDDGTYCTRTVMVDACADGWTVYLEEEGAIDGVFRRVCMGAEEE